MDVTCEECGQVSQIAHPETDGDPETDGWLYEDEETEFMAKTTAPDGSVVEVPATYRRQTAKYVLWLCGNPAHGLDGHLNRVEEAV